MIQRATHRCAFIAKLAQGRCTKSRFDNLNFVAFTAIEVFDQVDAFRFKVESEFVWIRFWNVETGECLKILCPDRVYEGMNIQEVTGLSNGQKAVLKQLGAVEKERNYSGLSF